MKAAQKKLLAVAVAAGLLFARAARADDPPKAEPKTESRTESAKSSSKLKVLKLDEFTVEGRIQKPQAFFILPRTNLSFEDADKKESFLPKIVKTCDKDPF